MTINFTKVPSFIGVTRAADNDCSIINGASGSAANVLMVGEDGNHYYFTNGTYVGLSDDANGLVCAESAAVNLITYTKLTADGVLVSSREACFLPCQGTKYFWVIGIQPTGHVTWLYSAALYKIVDDATIIKVNSIPQYDTRDIGPGGVFNTATTYAVHTNEDRSRIYFASHLLTYNGSIGHATGIASLPIREGSSEGGFIFNTSYPLLDDDFFNYANSTGNYQALTYVPDASALGYHYLITLRDADYAYMVAHPGDSASYSRFTRAGVYLWRPDFNTVTDVTDLFDLGDDAEHLDGSASASIKDTYIGCSCFTFNGTRLVTFNRSYSLHADLMTDSVGTYVHTQIFHWDGEVADKLYDDHSHLFDVLVDTGAAYAGTYAPDAVQVNLVGSTIYYLWGNTALASDHSDVVGGLLALDEPDEEAYHPYFSEFRDPDYIDWETVGGADFTSFLDTSFYLSSETSLFMEAPWVTSYLDNTTDYVVDQSEDQVVDESLNPVYVMPSLTLTPRWEWTDSQTNHKSGPTLNIYQFRTKSNVSDKRTRVRGKGRALQLHWESVSHKPFNLLGWSITVDENASY